MGSCPPRPLRQQWWGQKGPVTWAAVQSLASDPVPSPSPLETSLNHTIKNECVFPTGINQELSRASAASYLLGTPETRGDTPGTSTTHCQVAPGEPLQ